MRAVAIALALVMAGAGSAAAEPPAKPKATAPKPAAKQPAPAKIDLFPPSVLGDPLRGGGSNEERAGWSFGGGWKREAAVVGAMALGFAALVGLCSGGACMLPDWLPGTPDPGGINPPPSDPDPRIRSAR
jgi:hypothetical protein